MQPLLLSQIALATGGELLGADCEVSRVVTDSRQLAPGDLFVALSGERFDGNAFVEQAQAAGASAAVVTRRPSVELPCVLVADSRFALGQIAHLNRQSFNGPVIAISGSSGKTSCKEMLAAILRQRGAVLATRGNLNNEIGVPLTLLEIAQEHHCAVVEMGAAARGDIRYLCDFAHPDIALLTNAQRAHIAGFGSLEGVAHTKGEIYQALKSDGTAVINADDQFCELWCELAASRKRVLFSLNDPSADYYARDIQQDLSSGLRFTLVSPAGEVAIEMPLLGRHMVANALAAAAAAGAAGATLDDVRAGLAALQPVPGRLHPQRLSLPGGGAITLLDDSYNANPGSVRAAIDLLADAPARSWLLLGHMAELGDDEREQHADIGAYAAQSGVDALWAVGPRAALVAEAFGDGGRAFDDRDAIARELPAQLKDGDVVLVKGSRSAAMDRVVQQMTQQLLDGCQSRGEH